MSRRLSRRAVVRAILRRYVTRFNFFHKKNGPPVLTHKRPARRSLEA
jgi:hypothetical protein